MIQDVSWNYFESFLLACVQASTEMATALPLLVNCCTEKLVELSNLKFLLQHFKSLLML